jgi:hypothetical protein
MPRPGDQRVRDEYAEVWNGERWVRGSNRKGQANTDGESRPSASDVVNKAAPPKDEDIEDRDGDSAIIRASKRAKRAKRDAERAASGSSAGEQASAVAKVARQKP